METGDESMRTTKKENNGERTGHCIPISIFLQYSYRSEDPKVLAVASQGIVAHSYEGRAML